MLQVSPIALPSRAVWEARRAEVLAAMQEVMGPLPGTEKRVSLDVRLREEVDCGSYVRRLIDYASEPGGRVPAYLLIPKGQGPFPAVAQIQPTTSWDTESSSAWGAGPTAPMPASWPSAVLLRVAPAYPHLAQYRPDWAALGYVSGTMKAIWDNVRGLDVLEDIDEVRAGGVGAIGHSLGGHNAIYTATFDARIAVVVSSCGFDSYQAYKDGDITSWTSSCYMPRLRDYALAALISTIAAALAPRPFFASAPLRDDNFKWQTSRCRAAAARRVYALYGVEDRLSIAHPDCAHDFSLEMRERAYALFAQWL